MTFATAQAYRDAALLRRFGGPVLYTAPGAGTISVTGLIEKPSRSSTIGQRAVQSNFPVISVLKTEVPNLKKGDMVEAVDGKYAGLEFRVKKPNEDAGEIVSGELEQASHAA